MTVERTEAVELHRKALLRIKAPSGTRVGWYLRRLMDDHTEVYNRWGLVSYRR